MNKIICFIIIILTAHPLYGRDIEPDYTIKRGNIIYDFSFAELAVKYLETDDTAVLQEIAGLKATEHIMNHAKRFGYDVPASSKLELVKYLLSPVSENKKVLLDFKRNLNYAKDSIAEVDLPQKTALQYLPKEFSYSGTLYFTFGYDLGVAFGNNASINLAHPYFLRNMNEIRYYSIHELHHAGFIKLKGNIMPSLDITRYGELAQLIEYLTHLEGMGTFAPLVTRMRNNAMNTDKDYVGLQDSALMREYEKEYFDIYFHFKNNPDSILSSEDWDKVSILSDEKRLWYRVGALMAQTIDRKAGREKLVGLIHQPSENFIKTYLEIKDN